MTCTHHAWEAYPTSPIVVSDEEFYTNPLKDWTPPRYVPCLRCGAPIDRGRYEGMIHIPALNRGPEWPPWQEDAE